MKPSIWRAIVWSLLVIILCALYWWTMMVHSSRPHMLIAFGAFFFLFGIGGFVFLPREDSRYGLYGGPRTPRGRLLASATLLFCGLVLIVAGVFSPL
jgi:hypothetical protein